MARSIIIDTDMLADDALAILLAVVSPELDVKAITCMAGRDPVEVITQNIFLPSSGEKITAVSSNAANAATGARVTRRQLIRWQEAMVCGTCVTGNPERFPGSGFTQ